MIRATDRRRRGRWVGVALLLVAGCKSEAGHGGAPTASASEDPSLDPPDRKKILSIVDDLGWCDVDHRGLLLDLGTDAVAGRDVASSGSTRGSEVVEHEGATWARLQASALSLSFVLPEAEAAFVALRASGDEGRRADVLIDGVPVGQVVLSRAARIVSTPATRQPLDRGLHELSIRFRGPRSSDSFAEIDWIRIGNPDDLARGYGAPTLVDLRAPKAELGGVPRRALAMRAPTTVACTLRVPAGATLRTSVGMMGGGASTAGIAVREEGAPPVELRSLEVEGSSDARWLDLEIPLSPYAGRVVRVELSARDTRGTGRLMFGDPAVFVPAATAPEVPRARAAVLVVLDGVERGELPPWREDAPHAPNLRHLAATGLVFDDHRGMSTLSGTAVASLLTGQPPRALAMEGGASRLPRSITTLGDVAREGSVRAAMFTGVPTTFAAYGFDRHWESFFAFPPNEGRPASAPIDDAAAWLVADREKGSDARPMLAVVHARGGHPPWDLSPAEASQLPPSGYSGAVRPRDAAQFLAGLQGRHTRLVPADEERLRSMHFAGLHGQDAAIGRLVRQLEERGLWDSTLFVVTADVSSGLSTLFAEGMPLAESALSLPLYVHLPGGPSTGQRIASATDPSDVARTVLLSLGLQPPAEVGGRHLATLAARIDEEGSALRVAQGDGAYAARWGRFVLMGRGEGRRPTLCDLDRDPTCAFDHSRRAPFTAEALLRRYRALEGSWPTPPEREPITLDAATADMLQVWGVR